MQEADAERRIQILRGLPAVDAPRRSRSPAPASNEGSRERDGHDNGGRRDRKRRRIAGEDDTERDIRFALEDSATASSRQKLSLKPSRATDVPLTDRNGHINLFPTPPSRRQVSKNPEAEAEAARKKREFEDQYTMRFSNAGGFKNAIGAKPWYHSMSADADHGEKEAEGTEPVSKDVWGNEDPRRKERERARLAADDPLAIIQKGVSGLREIERERKKWKAEKERETQELLREEKKNKKKRKPRREKRRTNYDDDDDDLENFSLEHPHAADTRTSTHESSHQHNHHDHRHHRHRQHRDNHHHERDHHHHHHHAATPTDADEPNRRRNRSKSRQAPLSGTS